MLHLMKLAVGSSSLEDIQSHQHQQALAAQTTQKEAETPFITTRNFPRRSGEILENGSLFWVIGGAFCGRQRIRDIALYTREDGQSMTRITLFAELIPVIPYPMRPFQGWRYLESTKAPPDFGDNRSLTGLSSLPDHLVSELQLLCLL